jgi:hypothetical protein
MRHLRSYGHKQDQQRRFFETITGPIAPLIRTSFVTVKPLYVGTSLTRALRQSGYLAADQPINFLMEMRLFKRRSTTYSINPFIQK